MASLAIDGELLANSCLPTRKVKGRWSQYEVRLWRVLGLGVGGGGGGLHLGFQGLGVWIPLIFHDG